jgi:hypothetical protein
MTVGDLFVCLIAGLAVPLAILDAARTILEDRMPMQIEGLQFEHRALPWMLALLAGPALLADRVAEGWREGGMSRSDIAHGAVITLGWAGIYGFVVLRFAGYLVHG